MDCWSSGMVIPWPSGERSFLDRLRSSQNWGWVRLRGPLRRSARPGDGDLDVFHEGLVALGAVVADRAQDVHLRHVAGRAAAGDVVRDGEVAVEVAVGAVLGGAGDVDRVELGDAALAHVF